MRRNEKDGQKVIERIEMDATILNVLTCTKDGRPIKKTQLFMATNVWD